MKINFENKLQNPWCGPGPQDKMLVVYHRMPGYIYLIMMADGVYKVGRTRQDYGTHLKRLKSYPADSIIIYVRKTDDECEVERRIIDTFVKKFGKHPRGFEYFIGDECEMIRIIDLCVAPKLPLGWWDGQPMDIKRMIREIHARLPTKHFEFEELVQALEKRGYVIDPLGSVQRSQPETNVSF